MHNVIEQYKQAIVQVVGTVSGIVLLAFGCTAYKTLIEQMLTAIFYK